MVALLEALSNQRAKKLPGAVAQNFAARSLSCDSSLRLLVIRCWAVRRWQQLTQGRLDNKQVSDDGGIAYMCTV